MPKREAADYITKDGEGSMSAPPSFVPRTATAAQMAQRKLKAPRSRLHGGGSSTASSSSFSSGTVPNLFGQIGGGSNPFSTPFGNSNNSAASNLGASASFPPSKPSTINFAPAPPSGSFTFAPQTTSNPFADLGNNTGNNGPNKVGFGGFGAPTNGPTNSQSDGDTMMESPQKKPAAFRGVFGAAATAPTSAAPFSFGQSTASNPPPTFGASGTAQPPNNIFNLGQSQSTAQPGNLFGFGSQKPEEPSPPTSLFGQLVNTSQPAANQLGLPASAPSASNPFGNSASIFSPGNNALGQASTTSSTAANIFGSPAPAMQPATGGPFSTLFGPTPATTQPPSDFHLSSEASKPAFNFISTSEPTFSVSAAQAPTSNTASSNATPEARDLTQASSTPGFAGPIFSGSSNSTPFGNVFKSNAEKATASTETSGTSSGLPPANSNPFSFKTDTPSSGPGFPSNGGLFSFKPSESNKSGTLFEKAVPPHETASTTAVPATAQKPADDEAESRSTGDSFNPTSMLGQTSQPEQTPQSAAESNKAQDTPNQFSWGMQSDTSKQQPTSSSNMSFGNLFGASVAKSSPAVQQEKPRSQSSPSSSLFAPPSTAAPDVVGSHVAESEARRHAWPGPKPNPLPAKGSSSTGGLTTSAFSKGLAAPKFTSTASKTMTGTTSESDVRLRSYGSSAIPGYLDGDERLEHDSLSRLRNLNTSFQKNIAKLDPTADDFEEIVRHYVAQRARIGQSLNLKERNKAGIKRKSDTSRANEEELGASKKHRTEDFSSESPRTGMQSAMADSGDTSAAVPQPHSFGSRSAFQGSSQASNPGSTSATSSIFKGMMSSSANVSSASLSGSNTLHPSGHPLSGVKTSAPPSNILTSTGDATVGSSATTKDRTRSENPFASLNTPSSTKPNSAPLPSSTPSFQIQDASTTPAKSPPKKPVFEVPQFGSGSTTSFMDAFAKQSAKSAAELQDEAKRKRKAEEFDSDEDDEAEWERKYEEEERAKRNKLASGSKSAATGFRPVLGAQETSATAKTFFNLANNKTNSIGSGSDTETSSAALAGFGSTGAPRKDAEKPVNVTDEDSNGSRSSEEHDESGSQEVSDNSTEDENGPDEDDDASEGNHDQGEDEDESDSHPAEDESEDEDIQAAMARSRSKRSLFDRIEPNPNLKPKGASQNTAPSTQKTANGVSSFSSEAKTTPDGPKTSQAPVNSSFKPPGANGVFNSRPSTSTPSAPTMSPFTPVNGLGSDTSNPFAQTGSTFATSKKGEVEHATVARKTNGEQSSSAPNTSAPAPSPRRSVLFGGNTTVSSGTIPGEGLFGSRPSTPSNDEATRPGVFGNLGSGPNFASPQGDKTYQRGTPLKFGTPNKDAPTVNVTAATPPAKDDSTAASKSFPNLFGPKPSKPGADAVANVGFNFGGPAHLTAFPLLVPSTLSSAVSSRATSPSATDTESVNTDTAEEHSDEPQTSLMISRPGEENEEVLFEARSKALKFITEDMAKEKKLEPGYNTQGVGQLRVLKHKATGKTRLLLRAEPGSNIVINTALTSSITYKATETKGSGAVKFGIPTAAGIDHWVAKVKTAAMAEELAGILEANKVDVVQI